MDTEGWERAKEVFYEALERSPDERRELIDALDDDLKEEVKKLLAAHERAGAREAEASPLAEGPGTVIGRYKLLQQIGEGGFGVVYMAEQEEPVRRKVALKIIKLGMDTKQVVARFEAERQTLALLDHPNIAKILDGGATASGRPYFVMELVKGIPITDFCDEARLDTAARVKLFAEVCRAVQHAHGKGIIHRDLKPGNVLVTLHDSRPVPKIIDFGIAKATDRRLTEKTLFTEFKQIIGTPEYMAPEQAGLSSLDIDTRADVYSLGVLLYELITSKKPFDMESLLQKGYAEILRTIREVDPPKPSTRISTMGVELAGVGRHRRTPEKALGRLVRGDLDWIVMKAMDKDRVRRYETAVAMAEDLERHLDHLPVKAGPPGVAYRLRKYVRRHRAGVAAGVLVVLALLAGIAATSVGFLEASRQREVALDERDRADANAQEVGAERDAKEAARADLESALRRSQGIRLAAESRAVVREDPSLALLLAVEGARRHPGVMANNALLAALDAAPQQEVVLPWTDVTEASFSPDRRWLATGHNDGHVRITDATTFDVARDIPPVEAAEGRLQVRWSGDGSAVVTAFDTGGAIAAWNVWTGETLWRFSRPKDAKGFLSATGRFCWIAGDGGSATVIELPSGKTRLQLPAATGHWWYRCISETSERCLACSYFGSKSVRTALFDLQTGAQIFEVNGNALGQQAFSADGSRVLVRDADDLLEIRDAKSGEMLHKFGGDREHAVTHNALSPDGTRAIGLGRDRAYIWNARTGALVSDLERSGRGWAVISDDSRLAAWVDETSSAKLRVAELRTGSIVHEVPLPTAIVAPRAIDFAGRRILALDAAAVRIHGWETGRERLTVRGRAGRSCPLPVRGGRYLLAPGMGRLSAMLDLRTGETARIQHQDRFASSKPGPKGKSVLYMEFAAAVSPDGRLVATGGISGTVRIMEASTGRLLRSVPAHVLPVWSVAFSPDGTRLVTASEDQTARVFDVATGRRLHEFSGGRRTRAPGEYDLYGTHAAFLPDGSGVLASVKPNTPQIWDTETGELRQSFVGHDGPIQFANAGPGGTVIVTSDWTETRIWDARTGACRHVLEGHAGARFGTGPSPLRPDGRHVLVIVPRVGVRIHDTGSGACVKTLPLSDASDIRGISYSPDGAWILATRRSGQGLLWNAETGARALEFTAGTSSMGCPATFTEGSDALIVVDGQGRLRLIPVDLLAAATAALPRDLTDPERERYELDEGTGVPRGGGGLDRFDRPDRLTRYTEAYRCLCEALEEVDGEDANAEALATTLREEYEETGVGSWAVGMVLQAEAMRRGMEGRTEEARALLERALLAADSAVFAEARQYATTVPGLRERPELVMVIFRTRLEWLREHGEPRDRAGTLASFGAYLVGQRNHEDAEPILRECLEIRDDLLQPDDWRILNAKSYLGHALGGQQRFEEAEPLLLEAAEKLDPTRGSYYLSAIGRMYKLYRAWGKPALEEEWKRKLAAARGDAPASAGAK